jgi:hypothetical protein
VRDFLYETERLHQAGTHGFADPAQSEANDRDSELNPVDYLVEMLMEALDNAGAGAAGFDELLDSGIADADQGELRGREKRVRRHQEKDQEHAEQHKGYHLVGVVLRGNSNIPKEVAEMRDRSRLSLQTLNTREKEERRVKLLAFRATFFL